VTSLIVDAGPLVAWLDRRDRYHSWTRDYFDTVSPPFAVCEPVIVETCFLVQRYGGSQDAVLELVARGILSCEFQVAAELGSLRGLMRKFADVPMSLADACLVRMTELDRRGVVVTFDSDFRVYRRNGRQAVPTIMPT
jgi:uncharacterized protein